MPRRGEETSPAPRRSPRAAVKASASPSPIIRGSRSRSTSKQTTPKTRVASPSPKRRASSKNTKTEKDETPKQSGRAAKKVADKGKKSPASAKTPSTSGKSRSRGRQQKNVEEESEDGGEEEEKEEETKLSPPKSGSRAGRAKAAEPKKERAVPARKGRAQAKEESEEEADEVEKTKSEEKKHPEKSDTQQMDDGGGGGRTTARSRRSTTKQPEEVAATEEQSAPMARTARSRSRGQGKKAEDKPLTESLAVTESRSGRGRRSAEQTIVDEPKPSKDESVVQEEESEEVPKESLDTLDKDNTLKGRKRGNVDVERSPEKSPSSKRQRKLDGSSNESDILEPAPVQEEMSVSPSKVKSSVITPEEMQKKGVTKQLDEVAKSETMEVDDKEAEVNSRISPKASPAKQASGSPHGKNESLSSAQENRNQSKVPLITVQDADDLTGTKSSQKSLDTIDSSKSSIASNISPNKVSEIELSKSPKSSVDKELMKSRVRSPVTLEVTKSPVRSPVAPEVAKSPVRSPVAPEVAKSPVRSPIAAEVAKSPAVADVAKSPTAALSASSMVLEASRSPAKPAVVGETSVSPNVDMAKSPMTVDASDSPVEKDLSSAVKSPITAEISKSLVKSPLEKMVASDVKSPAVEINKSPVKSPMVAETVKSPVQSLSGSEVTKSPVKSQIVADPQKTPLSLGVSQGPVKVELVKSPSKISVMSPEAMDVSESSPGISVEMQSPKKSPGPSKSPAKSPIIAMDVSRSPLGPSMTTDMSKSPVKSPMSSETLKSPVKSSLDMEISRSPVKSPVSMGPSKLATTANVLKSPIDLTKCSKPLSETVKGPVKTPPRESLQTSESTKLSGLTDIPLSSSNVHNVTPSAATVDVKPVSAAVTGPLKDRDQTQKSLLSETIYTPTISSVSGMFTKSPLPSVATASPTSQVLDSSPVKSFPTTQTAASTSPLGVHSSISKPTPADCPVTPPKPSPSLSTRSPVISGMGISPSKPLTQPSGILESSHSQTKEAISATSCPVMPSSKSESLLSSSKQSSSQGSSVSPSKSPSSLETGRPSVYLSPTHQSLLQSIDKTVTPSKQPLLIPSATQSSTNQPVVPSPNHSPKPLAAPNSNLPLPSKEQDTTPLPTSKPVGSSPSLSPVKTPIVQGTNLPQPVIQSTNISQSVSLGINVSPVLGLHQSLVKSPIKTVSPEKPSTGSTSPSKPVNPLSPPGVLQKKPETLSPGNLNLTSPANKPLFVPTSPVKTSISPAVGSSLQAKPFSSQSSISPLKPVGHTEKSTWSSLPKLDTPVSSISPTKVNVTPESGSSPSKPTVVPSSGGSPTKSPSVPVGQLGTHSPTSKIIPSPVPPKSQQPFIQETKISSSQPAVTISGTKPQITHITGSVSGRPLVTHMTGVVPLKSTNPQSSVLTSMKPSSISPNKSQVSPGFSTTAKSTIGQGCSKPSIIPSAVTTLSKPQGHHESSGVSSKPLQTLGPTTLTSRPQITHMAGVAVHSRPQVTHMSGIAASSKSQTGPSSDINPHPKPPVVHVTGSAIPKSPGTISTGFSPSVAVSPPKTLHSSATFQSAAPASSANISSLSSSPFLSKCPSVPAMSAATGRPIVPPSSSVEGGGIQSVSPLKHTLESSNIVSAQLQAQPDSSHGRLLSNISLQTTPPSLTIASNIQSSQSLHPQKNISPTKPAFIPGILNKVTQPSSTSGQPIDPKAQLSISNVSSKAPNSSSSTPSAMSLFTTESKTPMETQSKVPIQVKPNLQATIPVISSTVTVPSSKTLSSTLISGSPSSPIISKVVGLAQPKVADSKAQSTGTVSVSPLPTVGSVQQVGTIPSTGLTSQPADSLLASSTSSEGGVINGAGAKASSVQVQPSTEANKKRKMDSDQPNEESPESKKARVSPDDPKSLISNGSKDASRVNQAPKISQDQSATKTEVMDIDPSPSTNQDSNGNEVSLKDYVIIDKNEVPHKDSLEVKESLPKMPLSKPTPAQSVSLSSSQNPESSSSARSSSDYVGSSAESTNLKDVLLNRTFKLNPTLFSGTITEKSKQFSVVTYNILADCHFRTNNKMDRYSAEEKPYILLPGRHKRLMAELCYVDADIVCLQEVEPEYYSKTLSPDMQKLGYEGFFKKRVHENFDEGETTFYKTSRFSDPENTAYSLKQLIDKDIQELSLSEDVKESVRKFMCRPDVLLVTRLRCKNTGKFITVGNIHVNWGQFKLPNLQCVQIARAIREVVNRAGNDSSPHVICGDFNSFPQAPGYQLASEGYLSDSMIHILQSSKTMEMPDGTKSALIDHLWQGFQHTSSSLKSAYAVVLGQEPELTTLTTHTRTCLDYVFYSSSSLEAVGVLQVPDKQIVLDCKFIPNKIFPSDHLSLKAVLAFK